MHDFIDVQPLRDSEKKLMHDLINAMYANDRDRVSEVLDLVPHSLHDDFTGALQVVMDSVNPAWELSQACEVEDDTLR